VKSTVLVVVRFVVVDVVEVESFATPDFAVAGLVGFVAPPFAVVELAFGPPEALGAFGADTVFVTFGGLEFLGPA
jgi:hypothetical protein